jgi:1,4-dihydroxy-2-naphthoate octaprenyltransferase
MKYILGVMRPPFLILGPACVFLGMATAIAAHSPVNPWHAVLCFVGAVLAHIAVNALNEYADIRSGLDLKTSPTPFSGGSGTLRQDPSKAPYALATGLVAALLTAIIGVYFAFSFGWPILAMGLLGLLIIFLYTPLFNHSPFLCLVSPGLGFGTLMVLGTYYVLAGSFSWAALLASFIPFFLVSNLLLLNQFPDAEADLSVGRRHYPILIGRKASAMLYVAFLAATYAVLILGVVLGLFPLWCLIGLATLFFAIPTSIAVLKNAENIPLLLPSLAQNVLLNILTPVLAGIGFLI